MGIKKGKACIFADCGLGKTPMQLSWAYQVSKHTGGKVLILAPLAVADQTLREAKKFGYEAKVVESQEDCITGINITNYGELKESYYQQMKGNVEEALNHGTMDCAVGQMSIEDFLPGFLAGIR